VLQENNNLEFGCFAAITCYTDDVLQDNPNNQEPRPGKSALAAQPGAVLYLEIRDYERITDNTQMDPCNV